MQFKIYPTKRFKSEAKRLIKKFPSLKSELLILAKELSNFPTTGTLILNNTYKIRISIKSKGKGKSGGARVITYVLTENKEVYLLTIFDKSEFSSIDDKQVLKIIKSL